VVPTLFGFWAGILSSSVITALDGSLPTTMHCRSGSALYRCGVTLPVVYRRTIFHLLLFARGGWFVATHVPEASCHYRFTTCKTFTCTYSLFLYTMLLFILILWQAFMYGFGSRGRRLPALFTHTRGTFFRGVVSFNVGWT